MNQYSFLENRSEDTTLSISVDWSDEKAQKLIDEFSQMKDHGIMSVESLIIPLGVNAWPSLRIKPPKWHHMIMYPVSLQPRSVKYVRVLLLWANPD